MSSISATASPGRAARHARRRGRGLPPFPRAVSIVIDGLAFGVLPEAASRLRSRHPLIALVHHPLALEAGLSAAASRHFARQRARGAGRGNPRHRHQRGDRAAPDRRLRRAGRAHRSRAPGQRSGAGGARAAATASCGCSRSARVVPRKGFDVLIAALATLADLPWQLTIAGDRGRDPKAAGAARCRYRAP